MRPICYRSRLDEPFNHVGLAFDPPKPARPIKTQAVSRPISPADIGRFLGGVARLLEPIADFLRRFGIGYRDTVGPCVMAAIIMLPDGARADSHGGGCWEWLASLPGLIAALAGVAALITAIFGVRATLETLRHKRYETAARIFDQEDGQNYIARTFAIVTLAKLAIDHPKDYDEPVMRVFEAFLSFPARYGRNARREGEVDYTSRETVAIVETINKRRPKQRRAYCVSLPPHRPFRVTENGDVEPNTDYDDPYAR